MEVHIGGSTNLSLVYHLYIANPVIYAFSMVGHEKNTKTFSHKHKKNKMSASCGAKNEFFVIQV